MSHYIEPLALEDAGARLSVFIGHDGVLVIQIDTQPETGRLRVYVNEATVFDQDAEAPSRLDYAALSREATA